MEKEVTVSQQLNKTLHSTHERLVQGPAALGGFFSRTQADENADFKLPLTAMKPIPGTGHAGKCQTSELKPERLTSEWLVGRKPKQLYEQYHLRDTLYWM